MTIKEVTACLPIGGWFTAWHTHDAIAELDSDIRLYCPTYESTSLCVEVQIYLYLMQSHNAELADLKERRDQARETILLDPNLAQDSCLQTIADMNCEQLLEWFDRIDQIEDSLLDDLIAEVNELNQDPALYFSNHDEQFESYGLWYIDPTQDPDYDADDDACFDY